MTEDCSAERLKPLYDRAYLACLEQVPVRRLMNIIPLMRLSPDDIVADFGCGNGSLLSVIHGLVREYVGVDFCQAFIARARERMHEAGITNGAFCCDDIVRFCEVNRERFTVACTFDFSEHLYDHDFARIYRAIHRSLRPGGRLYLYTPNGGFFIERMKRAQVLASIPSHVAVRNARQYRALILAAGFREVDVLRAPHYTTLRHLHPLSALPLAGDLFTARLFVTARR